MGRKQALHRKLIQKNFELDQFLSNVYQNPKSQFISGLSHFVNNLTRKENAPFLMQSVVLKYIIIPDE